MSFNVACLMIRSPSTTGDCTCILSPSGFLDAGSAPRSCHGVTSQKAVLLSVNSMGDLESRQLAHEYPIYKAVL
jgi:hypothetical protein